MFKKNIVSRLKVITHFCGCFRTCVYNHAPLDEWPSRVPAVPAALRVAQAAGGARRHARAPLRVRALSAPRQDQVSTVHTTQLVLYTTHILT